MIDFMFSDNELIHQSRLGDSNAEEELAKRYIKYVRMCARPYFLAGGDSEDLIQEGMLGLLSAIRNFNPNGNASFKTYAEQCIRNRILSAIESAACFKHFPLNQSVSMENFDEINSSDLRMIGENVYFRETEEQVLAKESESELFSNRYDLLSKFEKNVLEMYLQGHSYKEIAEILNRTEKSVDNAVQRIRKKFAQLK